jgi:hypothetical protein
VRRKLIWYSILGGIVLTLLAIVLRFAGINWPVPYLTYPGAYLPEIPRMDPMAVCGQSHLRRPFVLWVDVLGYAFVIFLLLRIFFPDRSSELPPLTGKK